jgi:cell filamentation protein
LAVVHVELVLIHPFRDGNGRVARTLCILMGLQAGLPALDFGDIKGKKKKEYSSAVQAGLDRNYEPMERIFTDVIGRTLKLHGR